MTDPLHNAKHILDRFRLDDRVALVVSGGTSTVEERRKRANS